MDRAFKPVRLRPFLRGKANELPKEENMKEFNIYLTGVGGQGIGLLSEIILRAADHAGLPVKGVDTHGLAQRGGVVVSQIRIGEHVFSPLIRPGFADLVVALERHEALRGMIGYLGEGGVLIYYNAVWQPLEVRLKKVREISEARISQACQKRHVRHYSIYIEDLPDSRMQNVALLASIDKLNLIQEVETTHFLLAMKDLMTGKMLDLNVELFKRIRESD
jgi:indolepyruvate ferredoxin oxidoreductase beta subunit